MLQTDCDQMTQEVRHNAEIRNINFELCKKTHYLTLHDINNVVFIFFKVDPTVSRINTGVKIHNVSLNNGVKYLFQTLKMINSCLITKRVMYEFLYWRTSLAHERKPREIITPVVHLTFIPHLQF